MAILHDLMFYIVLLYDCTSVPFKLRANFALNRCKSETLRVLLRPAGQDMDLAPVDWDDSILEGFMTQAF